MSKTTILIVEDEEIVAADLASKLARLGYEVRGSAARGEEAVGLARELQPNLVLMDIHLKGPMDGVAAAEVIRRQSDLPVIYLTAHSDRATVQRAKLTEPFGYILKPFEELELETHIEMALYKHRIERELRQSEERYRLLFDRSPDGVFVVDAAGRFVVANPACEIISGYSAAELLRMTFMDLCAPDQLARTVEVFHRAVNGLESLQLETALARKDGRRAEIWVVGDPLVEGRKTRLHCTVRDITERKKKEGELRLLSTAVASAVNGVAITDRNAQILWVNPAFSQLTGYTFGEAVGRTPRILKSGRNPPELYREMWTTLLKGEPWHGELVNRHKDGSLRDEEMTITPVHAHGAEITHFVAIKQDISERRRVQAALERTAADLERSNRDLEQFAYVASHDLQEPLRAVGGFVKLLERRFSKDLDAKAVEFIAGAAEGAERMERLISDLLAFSRVDAGGGAFAPADLNRLLAEALENLQASIAAAGAKVASDPLPTLTVDPAQVTRLFQNLVGNAVKFRGERPTQIHVVAQLEGDRWVFSVRDNGIGIEPEYFERIFQIFQRLHTRKHYPGTGIGLAICKKIVERHGGVIWVESQPGQGSVFCFSLPAPSSEPA